LHAAAAIELEIPARPEFVALARLVVSSLAVTRRALADERIDDLKLAVSEACTNAIEAHADIQLDERVVVEWREAEDRLEVLVQDRGPGFDLQSLPEHPPVTDPERLNFERGPASLSSARWSTRSTSTLRRRVRRSAW
jgi:serine/threonine-protein kinase RsbW